MAKTFTGTTTYPDVSPEAAFARHTDEAFLLRKFTALGGRDIKVEVTTDGDHVMLTVDRKVDADVPGFAARRCPTSFCTIATQVVTRGSSATVRRMTVAATP